MNTDFSFSSLIGNCFIYCDKNHLYINDKHIYFDWDITEIGVSKDKIFVFYTPIDGCSFDDLPRSNIAAFDFNANFLFDIESVIKESWPFSKMVLCNEIRVKKEPLTESLQTEANHEYLVCYTYGSLRFILDVTDEKLVQRVSGRFG